MGAIKWYEVSCDQCGCGEHFRIGKDWKIQARNTGWIISKGKPFCTKECLAKYKAAVTVKTKNKNRIIMV